MSAAGERLDRREFLGKSARFGAAVAAGSQLGWLASCGGDESPAPASTPAPDVDALARMLDGRVVTPDDRGYARARHLFNPRFDGIRPKAIAYADGVEDVRRAVGWARENEVPLVARNGGHSYAGYSTVDGVVVDLRRLRRVDVDPGGGTARIGAGALLIDVYSELARHGVTIPAGSCPTVGVTGLTLGGGIGLSGRKHGLTCDSLREIAVVTAAGEVVSADEKDNADLLWASRGGGGGNFGVATELRFQVHPVGDVAVYNLEWAWEDAHVVVDAWQRWAPNAPDELFSICKVQSVPGPGGSPRPSVTSFGQLLGSLAELKAVLEPLLDAAAPTQRSWSEMSFLDAQFHWAGCEAPARHCIRSTKRAAYKAKSAYVTDPFPPEAIDEVVRWVGRWPGSGSANGAAIQMDASGGAINRVPADATAFVHRDDLFHCQYLAYWDQGDPKRVADANLDWIADFYAAMERFGSGFAYQNYIDPDLGDWRRAYYGANYERLERVKQHYDPDRFFDFEQGIG
jgi:FAD/FMN-containing dehydrogenase